VVKHIVLFKAKAGKSEAEGKALLAELGGLKGKIDGIVDYYGGKNISSGVRTMGFTHGFVMTFTTAKALDAYSPHPEHQKLAAKVREFSDGVLVFDYEC